jgi:hypothetical protein
MEKSQKSVFLIALSAIALLAVAVFVYLTYFKPETPEDLNPMELRVTREEEGMTLVAAYLGESGWEYTVTGTVPNPCHETSVDVTVMESYPEQVNVTLNIVNTGGTCAQVIQNVEETGTFKASSEAQINFIINATPTM